MLRIVICGILLVACLCLATGGWVGGYEKVDVDEEDVVRAADEAARALSKQFAGRYHHRLLKVLKAKRQIVAGANYQMDIVVGKTTCEKSGPYDTECEFQDGVSTFKKCMIVVYRDLKDNHKLVSSGCILAAKNEI